MSEGVQFYGFNLALLDIGDKKEEEEEYIRDFKILPGVLLPFLIRNQNLFSKKRPKKLIIIALKQRQNLV